jgi:hypothetical protein
VTAEETVPREGKKETPQPTGDELNVRTTALIDKITRHLRQLEEG